MQITKEWMKNNTNNQNFSNYKIEVKTILFRSNISVPFFDLSFNSNTKLRHYFYQILHTI